jgi:uncharacterized membrane protein YccC
MAAGGTWQWWPEPKELIHAGRTTVAAVASLLIARLFRLSESYWAPITTIVVMQSTLGAAWTISRQRLEGTALGAAMGALLTSGFHSNFGVFAGGIFLAGVICAALRIERNAYRYAGITLAIVMLVTRTQPAWLIAIHRFVEISIGIAVGLALTAIWPDTKAQAAR